MANPHLEQLQINEALVLEATRVLAKSSPPEHKISQLLRLLSEWAHLHYGRVLLPNYSANALQPAYAYGLNKERLQCGDYTVPFDQGITGSVWRTGQPALVTDIHSEPFFLTRIAEPVNGSLQGIGFITVPILADGKTLGVLSAQRLTHAPRLFSHDVDLLRIVASLVASVLQQICQPAQYHVSIEALDQECVRMHQLCAAHGIIGTSQALMAAVKQIDSAKNSNAPVLLLGESGTGKEMFAAMAHQLSQRQRGPYVAINCAAIPDQLLESELFGHEKGSFTGAYKSKKGKLQQADGGTLFLDEIGDMPLDLQVKLLRVLQDRQVQPVGSESPVNVDFRIITATHVNLKQAVERGGFRLDLFFRLNVIPIALPPLRDRISDIPLLANFFLERYQGMYRRQVSFTTGAIERLQQYSWPGNIRQLQNLLERAVLQSENSLLTADFLGQLLLSESEFHPEPVSLSVGSVAPLPLPVQSRPEQEKLHTQTIHYRPYVRVETGDRINILEMLKTTGGNQTRAAELLGLTVRQLRYRLAKLA